MVDEDKRRQFDSEQGANSSRSHGFDKNPFDEFSDDIFKDKSRTYHDTFTSGSARKRKGDNITKEVAIDFVDAIKGSTIGRNFLTERSASRGRPLAQPAAATSASRALLPRAACPAEDPARPSTAGAES